MFAVVILSAIILLILAMVLWLGHMSAIANSGFGGLWIVPVYEVNFRLEIIYVICLTYQETFLFFLLSDPVVWELSHTPKQQGLTNRLPLFGQIKEFCQKRKNEV